MEKKRGQRPLQHVERSPNAVRSSYNLRNIKLSLGLDKGNRLLVHGCVRPIRDETLGVLKLIVLVPHFSTVTNHNRHGSIDNNVRWNVLKRYVRELHDVAQGEARSIHPLKAYNTVLTKFVIPLSEFTMASHGRLS